MQVSGKVSVLKDGPFSVNVSAKQTMVAVNKLIIGLTYSFSVCLLVLHNYATNDYDLYTDCFRSKHGRLLDLEMHQLLKLWKLFQEQSLQLHQV